MADPILDAITYGAFNGTISMRNSFSGIPPAVPDQINLGLHSVSGIGVAQRESLAANLMAVTPEPGAVNINPLTGKADRSMQAVLEAQIAKLENALPKAWFFEVMSRYRQMELERSLRGPKLQNNVLTDEEIQEAQPAELTSLDLGREAFNIVGPGITGSLDGPVGTTLGFNENGQRVEISNLTGKVAVAGRADEFGREIDFGPGGPSGSGGAGVSGGTGGPGSPGSAPGANGQAP